MKLIQLFILLTCITLLTACKEPTINASTYETMRSSYKDMLSSLPDKEKKQFSHAFNSIVFTYQNHVDFREKGDTREIIQKRLKLKIDGMNSSQVFEEYKKVRKKRALWDIAQAKKRIIHIENEYKQLDKVVIKQYELYMEKDGRLDRMFLNAVIHNGSKYKLSDALFTIRIGSSSSDTLSPERRDIYVTFPEGLESGFEVTKKIDLGYPTSQKYLPQNPFLFDHKTSRASGKGFDLNRNIYPTLDDLKKRLKQLKSKYSDEFSPKTNGT